MKRTQQQRFQHSWVLGSFIIAVFMTLGSSSYAQVKLGNNHSTIDDRSLLEMESSDKALMLPRLSNAQRDGQTGWKAGHVIYNTTDSCIAAFDGVAWKCLDSFSSPWYRVSDNKKAKAVDDTMYHLGSVNIGTGSTGGRYTFTVGDSCEASGDYSVAMGRRARATSNASFAFGDSSVASGKFSTAIGYLDSANGEGSVAIGYQSKATGRYSVALGYQSLNFADHSFCAGQSSLISSPCDYSLALGGGRVYGKDQHQIAIGGKSRGESAIAIGNTSWTGGENAMAIGRSATADGESAIAIGTEAYALRGKALSIGDYAVADTSCVAIGEKAAARDFPGGPSGTIYSMAFGYKSRVEGSYSVGLGYQTRVDHNNSLAIGSNATTTANNQLFAKFTGGYRFETNSGGSSGAYLSSGAGTWASISDRRAKQDIEDISYGLSHIMNLRPSTYKYKGGELQSLGFIAQEVREVIPEVVNVPENKEEMMSVRYTELIPVLTRAIQELNQKVENLESENKALKEVNTQLELNALELHTIKSELAEMQLLLRSNKINLVQKM
ncbi:MAG: tail fiber domain-containing protein [Bacteroidia bacterium]|nr:tail fiber domain-containing protein [Bacteroidia bacterium]